MVTFKSLTGQHYIPFTSEFTSAKYKLVLPNAIFFSVYYAACRKLALQREVRQVKKLIISSTIKPIGNFF